MLNKLKIDFARFVHKINQQFKTKYKYKRRFGINDEQEICTLDYQVCDQFFTIIYNVNEFGDNFIPYQNEKLEKKSNTILSAFVKDINVTDIINMLSGPKGNFYEDINVEIKFNESILPNIIETDKLQIIDATGNIKEVNYGDVLTIN